MGFPVVKNYRIIFGISSDQLLTINFTGLYAEVVDMYLCVPQTAVQSTLSMLILEFTPPAEIFEN